MQAWQQVKVTNENSGYVGQAGYVLRTEREADLEKVFVKLDVDGSIECFDHTELTDLG